MTKTILIVVAIALLGIGFLLGVYGASSNQSLGGTSYDVSNLVGDVYQGMTRVKMMADGVFVGPITTSEAVNISGRVALSNASSTVVTGNIGFTASSTGLLIRSNGSTCFLLSLNKGGNIATTSITCATTFP